MDNEVQQLQKELKTSKAEVTRLEKENKELTSVKAELEETIADMQEEIEQLAKAKKSGGKTPSELKVGKVTYRLLTPRFQLKGSQRVYSIEDLEADKNLVQQILEIKGQQILQPVK